MKVYWTPEALDDRKTIFEWIEADKPALGKPGRVDGARELVLHRNYLLVYEIANEQVWILRVLHAARRRPMHGEGGST